MGDMHVLKQKTKKLSRQKFYFFTVCYSHDPTDFLNNIVLEVWLLKPSEGAFQPGCCHGYDCDSMWPSSGISLSNIDLTLSAL